MTTKPKISVLYFADDDTDSTVVPGTTVTKDIEPIISKDYDNQLVLKVDGIQKALGVATMEAMDRGTVLKRYDETGELGDEQQEEGGEIPLTEFKRVKQPDIVLKLHKYARLTTWDAIAERGRENALNRMDARLIVLMAFNIIARFFRDAITKNATDAGPAANFQGAMANLWAAVTKAGEKYGDASVITFANPDDAKEYLSDVVIINQSDSGLQYVENIFGKGRLMLTSYVPAGTLYSTFRSNIRGAYINAGSEVANASGMTYDSTGMVGMKHSDDDVHGGIRTTAMESAEFFLDRQDLMFKSTIATAPPANDGADDDEQAAG